MNLRAFCPVTRQVGTSFLVGKMKTWVLSRRRASSERRQQPRHAPPDTGGVLFIATFIKANLKRWQFLWRERRRCRDVLVRSSPASIKCINASEASVVQSERVKGA